MTRTCLAASLVLAAGVTLVTPHAVLAQRAAATSGRRGGPGAVTPMTDISVTLGSTTTTGRVDANCHVDPRATPGSTRAYFVAMYPWFGQRVAADKPQWRVTLEIRRGTTTEASDQFVFSFFDGTRSGTIQTVAGAERMGSGTVKVTRHGNGARFDVTGTTKEGDSVRATIDCSAFRRSEAAGG